MVRLRCCLLQLQLLLAAVVIVSGAGIKAGMNPEWPRCGIFSYCLVYTSCFNAANRPATAGWIHFKNMGYYNDVKKPVGYEDGIGGSCERYITITPVKESNAKKVNILMSDKSGIENDELKMEFGQLKMFCLKNRMQIVGDSSAYTFNDHGGYNGGIFCNVTLETQDDTDIREKLTVAAGGKVTTNNGESRITTKGTLTVSGTEETTQDSKIQRTPYSSNIADVDLTTLKILCDGDRVSRLSDPNAVDRDTEFEAFPKAEFLLPNPNYAVSKDVKGPKAFADEDHIQCPPDAPMQFKENAGSSESVWKHVRDGLVCRRGSLTMTLANDVKKRVQSTDQIKCARKKCGMCEAPQKMEGKSGANAPKFDEAKEGDRCRTLKCDQKQFMVVKMKDTNEMLLHRKESIACSGDQTRTASGTQTITSKNWELDEKKGELAEAYCTTGVYCMELNPVRTESCETVNATCKEALLRETYEEGSGACPDGFNVVYVAPGTGNQITLSTFKCNNVIGKWEAMNSQNDPQAIANDALIRCEPIKEKTKSEKKVVFLGLTAVEVGCFGAGLALLVIAVIVAATLYICWIKKRKAAKKKAMESVSVTFKEPPNYKKGKHGSKRDRKERQVSVVNSLTGSLSGPASQSGSFTPIAPPSQLLPPGKRISKPDKGCAVLDINTGESKQMKWTNHTGDGPPTQRPTWQQSDSKQEDIQSAIKFAPGELEAARKKAQTKKKKEKSRQNSIEYNLGDPRQVKIDKSNIVNFDSEN